MQTDVEELKPTFQFVYYVCKHWEINYIWYKCPKVTLKLYETYSDNPITRV